MEPYNYNEKYLQSEIDKNKYSENYNIKIFKQNFNLIVKKLQLDNLNTCYEKCIDFDYNNNQNNCISNCLNLKNKTDKLVIEYFYNNINSYLLKNSNDNNINYEKYE